MTILHIGHGPHVARVMRLFARYAPEVGQRKVDYGQAQGQTADLVIVHNCTDYPTSVRLDALPAVASTGGGVVGWVWNDLWKNRSNLAPTMFDECALILADAESQSRWVTKTGKWYGHRPLVESEVFHPPAPGAVRDIPVLVARGWKRHREYWARETREALQGMEGVMWVDGKRTPQEMADLYRRARCVVALREDAGPSYTVVEACLCGAVPVVSDCPQMRKVPYSNGVGARFSCVMAKRDPGSIRQAVERALWIPPSEERDQAAYFFDWTAAAQGPALVRRVLEVTRRA